MKKLVSTVLSSHDQKAYIIKEAHELLFDGYQDKLIDRVRTVQGLLPLPVKMPYDRFGYMYGVSASISISTICLEIFTRNSYS